MWGDFTFEDIFPNYPIEIHGRQSSLRHLSKYNVRYGDIVQNLKIGTISDWSGNSKEGRYLYVRNGRIQVAYTKMRLGDSFSSPYFSKPVLSSSKPSLLWIPPGYYMGYKVLSRALCLLIYFNVPCLNFSFSEIRKPWNNWGEDIWNGIEVGEEKCKIKSFG